MKKKFLTAALAILCCFATSGCGSSNHPVASPGGNNTGTQDYYTQTNVSALEYQMYIANKVSVATGQINTHMVKMKNVANGTGTVEDEIADLKASIQIFKDDKIDITYVYPPDTYSATRDRALDYWQRTIDEFDEAITELEDKEITSERALEIATDLSDLYTSIQSLNFTA